MTTATVVGTTPDVLSASPPMMLARVERGRFVTDADLQKRARIVVLGSTVAAELFPEPSSVGRTVDLDGEPFRVVGEMASTKGPGTGDADRHIYVPFTCMPWIGREIAPRAEIDRIWLKVAEPHAEATRDVVETMLMRHHASGDVVVEVSQVRRAQVRPPILEPANTWWMLAILLGPLCFMSLLAASALAVVAFILWRSRAGHTSPP